MTERIDSSEGLLGDEHTKDGSTPAQPDARGVVDGASSSGESPVAVRLTHVQKHYHGVVAVEDLSLDVYDGEFLSILGPSGSGKTTTMRIIGGFTRPDAGRVEIGGKDVTESAPNRRDVNTVFQSYALFPHMSVEDNVAWGLKVRRVARPERRARVSEALELVQLGHVARRRPRELSGGMQQRVALARALVNRPKVLLLDEPLGALDRKLREDMQVELRRLQGALGSTFVYVTHDQEEALAMSDRVVVMRFGRVEQLAPPGVIYDHPATLWVAQFVGASNSMAGVVREVGRRTVVVCDAGCVVGASHTHGELAVGDRATVVIRPENVMVDLDDARGGGASPENVASVLIREIFQVGGRIRLVAVAGETALSAELTRAAEVTSLLGPGAHARFSWADDAVHVYPADGPSSTA